MLKSSDRHSLRGWIEILYRITKTPLKALDELDENDYMQVGSSMPLSEFGKPFEVLEWLSVENEGHPRLPERFDAINVVTVNPAGVTTYLVCHPKHDEPIMLPGMVLQWRQNPRGLGMLQVPEAFSSFRQTD